MMATNRILALCTLIVLSILAMLSTPVDSCMCSPSHPQTHYCQADWVMIARITKKSKRPTVNLKNMYKMEVRKVYKMTKDGYNVVTNGRLMTPTEDSFCGVDLKVGKLYVIAGRGKVAEIKLCNYVKEYVSMTKAERRGFAGAYKKGCSCRIDTCYKGECPRSEGSCNWVPWSKCETKYSACIPSRGELINGKPAKCHWRQTPLYNYCRFN